MPTLCVRVRWGGQRAPGRSLTPASADQRAAGRSASSPSGSLCPQGIPPGAKSNVCPLRLQPETRLLGRNRAEQRVWGRGPGPGTTGHQDGEPGAPSPLLAVGGFLPLASAARLSAPPHGFLGALMGIQPSLWDPPRGSPVCRSEQALRTWTQRGWQQAGGHEPSSLDRPPPRESVLGAASPLSPLPRLSAGRPENQLLRSSG